MRLLRSSLIQASVAVLALVLTACASSPPTASGPNQTSSPKRAHASPSASSSCVQATLQHLTSTQRVGQLFAMGLSNDQLSPASIAAIQGAHVGSVWFTQTTTAGVAGVRAVSGAVQAQATSAATAEVGFFVAANQEGGLIQALQGPGFSTIPSALTQGTLSPAVLQHDATLWGNQLATAGVNLDFAPVMDVVPKATASSNQPIGALDREFGYNPTIVANHGSAFIRGMASAGVATTAKHFPGLGRVIGNTDTTAAVTDTVTTPTDPYLGSFRAAVGAGVPFLMVSLATYTKIDPLHVAAFSPIVIRLLRGMGFEGVIVSDSLSASAVAATPLAARAIQFISAGGDLMVTKTPAMTEVMAKAVLDRASSDPAFASLVDSAVLHVLQAKDASGLLPCSAG